MLGAPPPDIDPKQKPRNPAGDKPLGPGRFLMLVGFLILASYVFFQVSYVSDSTNGNTSTNSESVTPTSRKPASIKDDDVSVLIIYPSLSWATDEQLLNEMAFAKSEWQKRNPHKHVVACDHLRERPTDYGYCWVIHYEKR